MSDYLHAVSRLCACPDEHLLKLLCMPPTEHPMLGYLMLGSDLLVHGCGTENVLYAVSTNWIYSYSTPRLEVRFDRFDHVVGLSLSTQGPRSDLTFQFQHSKATIESVLAWIRLQLKRGTYTRIHEAGQPLQPPLTNVNLVLEVPPEESPV